VIVDSSAILAILLDESGGDDYYAALRNAASSQIAAATYLETAIIADARPNPLVSNRLDPLLAQLDVRVVPFTPSHAQIARAAYRDFGRGSGHPAKLNFGDCFAYALAIDMDEPLLFKGDDFIHTDVRVALAG
jgi:ribonuclease VapC